MKHTNRTPTTLTEAEVSALLAATSRSEADLRDHLILAIALGTGLRLSEIVSLNISDVKNGKGAKGVWELRPETTKGNKPGTIGLPDRLRRKVSAYLRWKADRGESVEPEAPLFQSRGGGKNGKAGGGQISGRTVQHLFKVWQQRCGFDRTLTFHSLRHTFCTSLWRSSGDLRLVQQAARHSSPSTTSIYTHPSLSDVLTAVQDIPC